MFADDDLRAGRAPCIAGVARGLLGGGDQRRGIVVEEPQGCRHATGRIHDHPNRWPTPVLWVARGKEWVVGEGRPRTDEDSVRSCPHPVDLCPGLLARDPRGRAVGPRDASVERGRQLEGHERDAGCDVLHVGLVLPHGFCLQNTLDNLDPSSAQVFRAATINDRIGITRRDHGAGDPGIDDRLRAGWCSPEVVAGLERAVEGSAACALSGFDQRHRFGVSGSGTFVPTLAEGRTVGRDNDGANEGIRRSVASTPLGQFQRSPDIRFVQDEPFPERGLGETGARMRRSTRPLPSRL